jgi:hypothetical protein
VLPDLIGHHELIAVSLRTRRRILYVSTQFALKASPSSQLRMARWLTGTLEGSIGSAPIVLSLSLSNPTKNAKPVVCRVGFPTTHKRQQFRNPQAARTYRQPEPNDDQLLMIQVTEPSGDVTKVSAVRGAAPAVSLPVRKATTKTWQPFMPD